MSEDLNSLPALNSGEILNFRMGLVRGNTQDIGKNLVVLMVKANGFNVIDLGKNVKPVQFMEAAQAHHAVAIGMSVMTNSSVVYAQ
jgi:methanogenic corrinoid protein MtbC1